MAAFIKMTFSAGLVVVLLFTSDLAEVFNTITNSDYRYFIISVIISFAAMFLATLRWQILLGRFNFKSDFSFLFALIGLSYFYNFFVPGGVAGDIVRGVQCRKDQLSVTQGVASVVVDRVIGLGSFILIGLVGCLVSLDALKAPFSAWLWAVLTGSVVGGWVCFNRRLMRHFRVLSGLYPSGYKKLKLFYESVYEYKDHGRITARAMGVSLFTALVNIGSFYLLSRAAGSDVEFTYFLIYIPVITVLSYVPVSYSGLGLRELCFVLFFGRIGMTTSQALAVPLMYFGMILVLSLVGGLVFLVSRPVRKIKVPSIESHLSAQDVPRSLP